MTGTTGAYVSKNWLAMVRIAKVLYYWCARNGDKDRREGSDDLLRTVVSFTAVVARVMSHSGSTEDGARDTDDHIKEVLSCIRELDILVRHDKIGHAEAKKSKTTPPAAPNAEPTPSSAASKPRRAKKKKAGDEKEDDAGSKAWWTISNYVSLLNLTQLILLLGPLVNWWDGGGKGERFIQLIKPLITRGVRTNDTFMVRVVERFYKLRVLTLMDEKYNLFSPSDNANNNCTKIEGFAEYYFDQDGNLRPVEDFVGDDEDDNESCTSSDTADDKEREYSPVEDRQMHKARTIYIYRNRGELESALQNNEPISGIIISEQAPGAAARTSELYVVFRVKKEKNMQNSSRFGWLKIEFRDNLGEQRGGLWYAPINVNVMPGAAPAPASEEEISTVAKMAAVAIPQRYATGEMNTESSRKYCVITNWWKERSQEGTYKLASLDTSLYVYQRPDNQELVEEATNRNVI